MECSERNFGSSDSESVHACFDHVCFVFAISDHVMSFKRPMDSLGNITCSNLGKQHTSLKWSIAKLFERKLEPFYSSLSLLVIASSLLYKCCSVKASLSVRICRSKRLFSSFLFWLSFSLHTVPLRLRVLAHVLTLYVKVIFLINITFSLVPLARVFQMIAYVNLASKSPLPGTQFVWTSEYSIKWIITMYIHLMINTANFCVKTL